MENAYIILKNEQVFIVPEEARLRTIRDNGGMDNVLSQGKFISIAENNAHITPDKNEADADFPLATFIRDKEIVEKFLNIKTVDKYVLKVWCEPKAATEFSDWKTVATFHNYQFAEALMLNLVKLHPTNHYNIETI